MAENLPCSSIPGGRVLVKLFCLNPLFGWGQDLTCHMGEVVRKASLVPGIASRCS